MATRTELELDKQGPAKPWDACSLLLQHITPWPNYPCFSL